MTMDSFVCAMSVMTPSEMMSRMKYCEPSGTAEAYLRAQEEERVSAQRSLTSAASVGAWRLSRPRSADVEPRGGSVI